MNKIKVTFYNNEDAECRQDHPTNPHIRNQQISCRHQSNISNRMSHIEIFFGFLKLFRILKVYRVAIA